MQQLYAIDANDEQIDINIKKGTDLLVDGKSVTQALKDIDTNALGIANNSVRIESLETLTSTMSNEYRTGIASSIALSQIQYAPDGFSIGIGHGRFKDRNEMAIGIGYGGQFDEKVGYQFQFGSSSDSTGFGFTVRF